MAESVFNATVEDMKRVDLVTVSGRIDSNNAPQFDDILKAITDRGRYNVVLDMQGVDYISSAGLRAIVALLRETNKHRGDVRLAAPSGRVAEVLQLAGLDALFKVYDDSVSAVGSF